LRHWLKFLGKISDIVFTEERDECHSFNTIGVQDAERSMRLFAEEVMPHFCREAVASSVASSGGCRLDLLSPMP